MFTLSVLGCLGCSVPERPDGSLATTDLGLTPLPDGGNGSPEAAAAAIPGADGFPTDTLAPAPPGTCGNGNIDGDEDCDDGNRLAGDGCNPNCRFERTCGDGAVDPGEECDQLADDCNTCQVEARDISNGGLYQGAFQMASFDRYRFRLRDDALVLLTTSDGRYGCPGDLDISVLVKDPEDNLNQVAVDHSSGPGVCGQLAVDLTANGLDGPIEYEVIVSGRGGIGVGDYMLGVYFSPESSGCGDGVINVGEECDAGTPMAGDWPSQPRMDDLQVGGMCDETCIWSTVCGDGVVEGREVCDPGRSAGQPAVETENCDSACSFENVSITRGRASFDGVIPGGAQDRYAFVSDGPSYLDVAVDNGTGDCSEALAMTGLALRNLSLIESQGREMIGIVDGPDSVCPRLTLPACPADGACIDQGPYEVAVRNAVDGTEVPLYGLTYLLYRVLAEPGIYRGSFPDGGSDIYRLNLEEEQRVEMETTGSPDPCPGDTRLLLSRIDADGNRQQVQADEDSGEGPCSRFDAVLPPGQYEAVVTGGEDGAGLAQYGLAFRLVGSCGDGRLSIGEECDDGNGTDDDGCSSSCRLEFACGNGIVDDGEDCDDRNRVSGDGCDGLCTGEFFDIVQSDVRLRGALSAGSSDIYRFATEGPSRIVASVLDENGRCTAAVHTLADLTAVMANGVRTPLEIDATSRPPCPVFDLNLQAGAHELTLTPSINGQSVPDYFLAIRLTRDVSSGGSFRGSFPASGSDIYTFTLSTAQAVRLQTSDGAGGCASDSEMTLRRILDDRSVDLIRDDDGGVGTCSKMETTLQPGQYELIVAGAEGAAIATYDLEVNLEAE